MSDDEAIMLGFTVVTLQNRNKYVSRMPIEFLIARKYNAWVEDDFIEICLLDRTWIAVRPEEISTLQGRTELDLDDFNHPPFAP